VLRNTVPLNAKYLFSVVCLISLFILGPFVALHRAIVATTDFTYFILPVT